MNGSLFIVGIPIGNLKDITLRALEILKEKDIIFAEDTRNILKLLNYYNIKKKIFSFNANSPAVRIENIINRLLSGEDVIYVVDSGTPCISDPGHALAASAHSSGINVISIPGPSSLTAAISVSGLNCSAFHYCGFLPGRPGRRIKKS